MIGFLLNNNLAPIGSSVISTCSPTDLFEQRERNVPLASADVRGGGILRDEPKERLRRRLLLTKCEVKMAGYWPSSFFCVFMDRDGVEVHKLAKKERGQFPAILTEQTWSIKDLLYGFRELFLAGHGG